MGGSENQVTLITEQGTDTWPRMTKDDTARALAARMADAMGQGA